MDKRTLFPLPSPIDDGSRRCVQLWIPDIPGHRQALTGAIYNLTRWYSWDRDSEKQGREAAQVWEGVYNDLMANFDNGCGDDGRCFDYVTSHPSITFAPNDPYRSPDYVPPGYQFAPWYRNAAVPLPGILPMDAMVNFLAIPNIFAIPTAGFPRARIHVAGAGQLQINFLQIPQGGIVMLAADDDPTTIEFIDMTSLGVTEITSLGFILALLGIETDASFTQERIWEYEFTSGGNHHVDITFLPNISVTDELVIGFGGGIRSFTYCTDSENVSCGAPDMFRFTAECGLETSQDGINWVLVPGWSEFAAACFTGDPGAPGEPGAPGDPGASVELRVNEGWVEWRQDDDDPTWTQLYPVPEDAGAEPDIDAMNCRYARAFMDGLLNLHMYEWGKAVNNAVIAEVPISEMETILVDGAGYNLEGDALADFVLFVRGLYIDELNNPGTIEQYFSELLHEDNVNSLATRMACVMGDAITFCPEHVTAFIYRYENWFNTAFWYSRANLLIRSLLLNNLAELNADAGRLFWVTCDYSCATDENACDDFPPPPEPEPWQYDAPLSAEPFLWESWDSTDHNTHWVETVGFRPTNGSLPFNTSCIGLELERPDMLLTSVHVYLGIGRSEPYYVRLILREQGTGDDIEIEEPLNSFTDEMLFILPEPYTVYSRVRIQVKTQSGDCSNPPFIEEWAVNRVTLNGIGENPFD